MMVSVMMSVVPMVSVMSMRKFLSDFERISSSCLERLDHFEKLGNSRCVSSKRSDHLVNKDKSSNGPRKVDKESSDSDDIAGHF